MMNQFKLSTLLSISPSVEVSIDSTDDRADYLPELKEMGIVEINDGYYRLTDDGKFVIETVVKNCDWALKVIAK
jgi:Mn-dependent DtxR family transcriptional regulator